MMQMRIATNEDTKQFKALWKICFGDSDQFIDWFFENRFLSEYSVCLEEDGKIISCMQSYPYHINVRDKLVAGAMLAGVCTHPNYRKKGHMKTIFTFMMNLLYEKGIVLAVHTPAVLESYFNYGHFPVSDACYVFAAERPAQKAPADIFELAIIPSKLQELYDCYRRNMEGLSGSVSRTFADFEKKAQDYGCDGGKCIVYAPNGSVLGYCFYYLTKDTIQAVEIICDNIESYERLLSALCVYHPKLQLMAKLPPNQKINLPFAQFEIKQKGVMGLVNLSKLLRIVSPEKGYAIGVHDEVVRANDGVFNLQGEAVNDSPDVEMDAGSLMQLIVGYQTLMELKQAGRAIFHNYEKALEINRLFSEAPCYIIDEY